MIARLLILFVAFLGPVEQLDVGVQRAVENIRGPALEPVMRWASSSGKPVTVLGLLLGIAVFGGPGGVETARVALLTAAPVNLVVEVVKRWTDRTRPDGEHKPANASFPSSHAANAFALAAVFARRRRGFAWVFWLLAGIVAFSRLYLNRHYLSDVVAGALIGVLCAWAVARLIEARSKGSVTGPKGRRG